MRTAYLDCFSGISGDMFVGALLDAGLPLARLDEGIRALGLEGVRLTARRERRRHIAGTRFMVEDAAEGHVHRTFADIRRLIEAAALAQPVKERAIAVFRDLAEAEGAIHDEPPDTVHFHEVGAVDSIVDIVGTVLGLDALGIEELHVAALPVGTGFVASAHGRLPLPAPATLALLKGLPVYSAGVPCEMVTPTGAALVRGLAASVGAMPPLVVEAIGYGVGSRDLEDRPNLARLLVGRRAPDTLDETVAVLTSNVDDAAPEFLGFVMERLFAAGALDVALVPVYMKKNRPGTQIQVVARPGHSEALSRILLSETTLGVRVDLIQRRMVARETVTRESPWGPLAVKQAVDPDGKARYLPEYEACRSMALKHGIPLRDVYGWVMGLNRPAEGS